jgi:hypothetical protein
MSGARSLRGTLLAAGLLAGCSLLPHAPLPEVYEGEWPEARDAATRFTNLYDGFEHRANLWTIRLTPEVRELRARRLAKWLSWSAAELEAKLAAERAEGAKWDDFIVLLYTANPKWNDLDAPSSVWRIEFDMGGDEVVMAQAQSLERNATFEALYPMTGPFDTAYRLRFPHAEGTPGLLPGVLHLASALGELRAAYTPGAKPTFAPRQAN